MTFNLTLIAPACDFKLLAETLKSAGRRIVGFRIFGMGDSVERTDAILPVIYPSSLLYFVSGVLENESDKPLAGMARYYTEPYSESKFPEIDYVRTFSLLKRENALIWSISNAGDGISCDMTSHGGWTESEATLKSILYILAKGFGYHQIPNFPIRETTR
jgi:hypothetical protein